MALGGRIVSHVSDRAPLWALVFFLHCVWFVLLPGLSGKALAAIGAATSLLFLLPETIAGSRERIGSVVCPPALLASRARLLVPALFLLPAVSLVREFTFVFWHLDGRAWIAIAWVMGLFALGCARSAANDGASRSAWPTPSAAHAVTAALFVAWTSILWLTIVLDLGVEHFIVNIDRSTPVGCRSDLLTVTFSTWERTPASEHLFLAWRSEQHFADRLAYENHVPPYLLAMYAWTGAVRIAGDLPLFVASNTTPMAYLMAIVGAALVLWQRTGVLARCQRPIAYVALFAASATLVTTWRFWNDLYRFNTDHPYPLIAAVLVAVYAFLLRPRRPRAATAAAAAFVALSPIHMPMLLVAVGCLFGKAGGTLRKLATRNQSILWLLGVSTVVGIVTMGLPRVLVAWRGYTGQGSSLMYRSGLDGSTDYLTDLIQAVWSGCPTCCGPRPVSTLLFPAILPLLAFFWQSRRSPAVRRMGGYLRLLLFLTVPYWMSVIFFPQSVAVHPYLYDHVLIVPIVIAGATAMLTASLTSRWRGPYLLLFLLFAAAVIMSNLLKIAQTFAAIGGEA